MANFAGEPDETPRSVEGDVWREVRGGATENYERGAVGGSPATSPLRMDQSDHWLGRIALYYVAHPTIPDLYQCCFDYVEPWDWSRETERVATGRWIHRRTADDQGR